MINMSQRFDRPLTFEVTKWNEGIYLTRSQWEVNSSDSAVIWFFQVGFQSKKHKEPGIILTRLETH